MRRIPIGVYWAMLMVPTLLMGWFGYRLIQRERGRVSVEALEALRGRAALTAETIAIAIAETEGALIAEIKAQPPDNLAAALQNWAAANPLARNVFVWTPGGDLLLPAKDTPQTREEEEFVRRYEALFSGKVPFEKPAHEGGATTSSSGAGKVLDQSRQMRKTARHETKESFPGSSGNAATEGWLPWYDDNQVHLLGWVRGKVGAPVYGVELEWMALLSTLAPLFSEPTSAGYALTLEDGEGNRIYQQGRLDDMDSAGELAAAPIGPLLPHWRVVCRAPDGWSPAAGRGLILLYSTLLSILIIALLTGATLLFLQARQSHREALQKTTFVSNVSHELKTPLTTIRMYSELLEEGRIADEDKRKRYLSIIGEESRRLARLVNNVLDFSSLEQHRKKYTLISFDARETAQAVAAQQALRCRETGVDLRIREPDGALMVYADRDAMGQALLNLVDNAIKYGGADKPVEIGLRREDTRILLEVSDRGPGVPWLQHARIFEKFYRADTSLTTATPGSGLGLTIARQLARDMGGDVIYEPREGGGSCFRIILEAHI